MFKKFDILCEEIISSLPPEPKKPVALKPQLDKIEHELQIGGTITDEDIAPFVEDANILTERPQSAIFVRPLYFLLLKYKQCHPLLRKNINTFIDIIASSSEQSRRFAGQVIVNARHSISQGKNSSAIIPEPILKRLSRSPSIISELLKNQDALSDETIAELKKLAEIRQKMAQTPKDTLDNESDYADISTLPKGKVDPENLREIPVLDMGPKLQKRHKSGSESIRPLPTKFDKFKRGLGKGLKSIGNKFGRK